MGGHARQLHDARLPGRRDGAIRLGTLVTGITYRNVAHLAKIVATLDIAVGRPGAVRHRRRVVRARAPAVRLGVPAAARALRAARGRARAAAAHVGAGRAALRGPHDHRAGGDLLPAAAPGARPDPRRRLGRAADAAARRAPRRRVQPVRRPGDRPPQGRGPARALRGRGPRPGDDRDHAPRRRARRRRRRPREGRGAATVEEHVGRYRELAEAGVQTAIVGLSDTAGPESVERFADVIAAFRGA